MDLRDFLNAIFAFINIDSIADEEWNNILEPLDLEEEYSLATYNGLKSVLASRESISDAYSKLGNYYKAKGIDLSAPEVAPTPITNIFVGGVLE